MKAIFINRDFNITDLTYLNQELSEITAIINTISTDNGYILIVVNEKNLN